MSLATLSIDLVVKLAEFQTSLNEAVASSKKASDEIAHGFESARDAISDLAKELVGIISVEWFKSMVEGAIEAQAELYKLSKGVQMTVEQFGALDFAAKQAGISTESVTSAMSRLNVQVAKATSGDVKAADPFIKMGFAIKDLQNLSPDELIGKLAEKFNSYEDSANKAALGNALFGRNYREIIALLTEGKQAMQENEDFWKRYSGVTAESAKASEELEQAFGRFMLVTKSVWAHLVNELGPAINAILESLTKWSIESDDAKNSASSLMQLFQSLAQAVLWVSEQIRFASAELDTLRSKLLYFSAVVQEVGKTFTKADWLTDPFGTLVKSLEITAAAMKPGLKKINDQYDETIAKIKSSNDALLRSITSTTQGANPFDNPLFDSTQAAKKAAPALDPKAAANAKALEAAFESLTHKLQEQINTVVASQNAFSHLQKVQEELATNPKYAQFTDAQTKSLEAQGQKLDDLALRWSQLNTEQQKFMKGEIEGYAATEKFLAAQKTAEEDRMHALLMSTPDEQLKALVVFEDKIRHAGLTADQTAAMIYKLYNINPDPAIAAVTKMDMALQDLAKNLDTAIGKGLADALSGNFQNIAADFKKMIEDMIVKATQADLADLLFGPQTAAGGTGKVGGWLGSLVGMVGGMLGGGGGGGAAGALGSAASAAVGGGGGTGGDVNVTYQIASGVSRNELAALMPTIINQTKGAVLQTMQRPGFEGG
jgi:hypothetical protein